ncbi:MAG: heme biosynthesis HemY N-terminal domain-containing protein [Pseudomonadota bacterium]
MILFLAIFLIVVAAYFLAKLISIDTGYVLISYAGHAFELSFWWGLFLTIITFVTLYILFRLIAAVLSTGNVLGRWSKRRKRKSSSVNLSQGLLSFFDGDFKTAAKSLSNSAKSSYTPELNYLAAAKACVMNEDFDAANSLLERAKECQEESGSKHTAIELSRAELNLEDGNYQACADECLSMLKKKPKHELANRYLLDAYLGLGDWPAVESLLPTLKKRKVLSNDEFDFYKEQTVVNQISIAHESGLSGLQTLWKGLSSDLKANPHLVKEYASSLLELSALSEAESVLASALKKEWDADLASMYIDIDLPGSPQQLKTVVSWLSSDDRNVKLLNMAGEIALKSGQTDVAKMHLEKSLMLEQTMKANVLLARLHDGAGNTDDALGYYRRAFES